MDVNPDKPLVVCVSRRVPQKGVDLIRHAISHVKDQGGQRGRNRVGRTATRRFRKPRRRCINGTGTSSCSFSTPIS